MHGIPKKLLHLQPRVISYRPIHPGEVLKDEAAFFKLCIKDYFYSSFWF